MLKFLNFLYLVATILTLTALGFYCYEIYQTKGNESSSVGNILGLVSILLVFIARYSESALDTDAKLISTIESLKGEVEDLNNKINILIGSINNETKKQNLNLPSSTKPKRKNKSKGKKKKY